MVEGSIQLRLLLAWELFRELRDDFEEVSDQSVVCDLEDGRLWVLVDGHDGFAVLHACQVLDGSGDADGQVKLWCHHLARLTDLQVVRAHSRVHRRTRRSQRPAKLIRKLFEHFEVFLRLEGPASGDDDPSRVELGPLALALLLPDPLAQRLGCRSRRHFFRTHRGDLRPGPLSGFEGLAAEGGRPHGQEQRALADELHGRQRVARVDGPHEGGLVDDLDDVGDRGRVEERGDARQEVLAEGVGARDDVGGLELAHEGRDDLRQRLGQEAVRPLLVRDAVEDRLDAGEGGDLPRRLLAGALGVGRHQRDEGLGQVLLRARQGRLARAVQPTRPVLRLDDAKRSQAPLARLLAALPRAPQALQQSPRPHLTARAANLCQLLSASPLCACRLRHANL
mmetsp:Transcript_28681/g.60422  ORF Transcript_28681/g.60422 Transcript_28681/m.60422 type:complete len:395 (+) Transcript_28681:63-1247(+)